MNDYDAFVPPYLKGSTAYYVTVITSDGGCVYVNDHFLSQFSFEKNKYCELPLRSRIHEDDVPLFKEAISRSLKNPEKTEITKVRMVDKSTSGYKHVSWELSAFEKQEGDQTLLAIGFDKTNEQSLIQELVNSEAHLRAVYNSTNIAATYLDPDLRIRFSNHVADSLNLQLFGKKPKVGDSMLDFILPDYQLQFHTHYKQVLNGKRINFEKEYQNKWWYFSLFPIYNEKNKLIGIAHNVKNVTRRKNNELKIIHQNERLKEIAKQHSHEIRGPVTSLMAAISLLQNDEKRGLEEVKFILNQMHDHILTLDDITHKIVTHSEKGVVKQGE